MRSVHTMSIGARIGRRMRLIATFPAAFSNVLVADNMIKGTEYYNMSNNAIYINVGLQFRKYIDNGAAKGIN